MKLRRQVDDVRRPAVSGAVGDDEPALELRDRVVVRIEGITPTAVQKHNRRAAATLLIAEIDRSCSGQKWGGVDRHPQGGELRGHEPEASGNPVRAVHVEKACALCSSRRYSLSRAPRAEMT